MRKNVALPLYTLTLCLLQVSQAALADAPEGTDDSVPVYREREGDTSAYPAQPPVQHGAVTPTTKQYDPRLPPVLPGELVITESGQKMHVWSSAGPVPVSTPSTNSIGDVDILIDGRREPHRRGPQGDRDSGHRHPDGQHPGHGNPGHSHPGQGHPDLGHPGRPR